ncbi:MAG: MerR family transcriptional regulator [Planctomycetota bacterium]
MTSPKEGEGSGTDLLRTKDVLEATGITHQMLYRYVTLGLVEESGSTSGGLRLFHPRVIPLIDHIRGLNDTGYSLRDIKEIFFKDQRVRKTFQPGGDADGDVSD